MSDAGAMSDAGTRRELNQLHRRVDENARDIDRNAEAVARLAAKLENGALQDIAMIKRAGLALAGGMLVTFTAAVLNLVL